MFKLGRLDLNLLQKECNALSGRVEDALKVGGIDVQKGRETLRVNGGCALYFRHVAVRRDTKADAVGQFERRGQADGRTVDVCDQLQKRSVNYRSCGWLVEIGIITQLPK